MRTWVNVATAMAIWLMAGGALFDQSYGWWAGFKPVIRLPVHSDAIYVLFAVMVWGVIVLLTNLCLTATRGRERSKVSYWLYPSILLAGLLAPWIPGNYANALTIRVLGPGSRGDILLINSAAAGRTSVVQALLDAGIAPDTHVAGGDTALHYAASRGHIEIITLLIDRGANVNMTGRHGLTPLHHAEQSKNREAIEVLMAHGARKY
jgi:Ankyrin repeats (3 copies)